MTVAQLIGDERFEPGPVGRKHGLGEGRDRIGNGGGVSRLGEHGRVSKD